MSNSYSYSSTSNSNDSSGSNDQSQIGVHCSWVCIQSPGVIEQGVVRSESSSNKSGSKSNRISSDSQSKSSSFTSSMRYLMSSDYGHIHSNASGSSKNSHHTHEGLVSSSHSHELVQHCHYVCTPDPCATSAVSLSRLSSETSASHSKHSHSESVSGSKLGSRSSSGDKIVSHASYGHSTSSSGSKSGGSNSERSRLSSGSKSGGESSTNGSKSGGSSFSIKSSISYTSRTSKSLHSKYDHIVSTSGSSISSSKSVYSEDVENIHATFYDMTSPTKVNNTKQEDEWDTPNSIQAITEESSSSICIVATNMITTLSIIVLVQIMR